MYQEIKKLSLIITLVFSTGLSFAQGNADCDQMEPICTGVGLSFTAQTGVSIEPGNDYGCLGSQPNPTWYYFEIATSGDINMNLFAPSDIDFIIWGPFTDFATAVSNCGQMGVVAGAPEVDCSYSGTNNEFPVIPGTVAGEVYVMLITNYASVVQDVTLTQVGGTGATDCNIIIPDPCVSNPGTYNVMKNGVLSASPVYLCEGDDFDAISNNNFILPNDTLAQPVGDGVYSAQLMWLVYDALPISTDPSTDPGFLNIILPTEDLGDINNMSSPIVSGVGLGCGTYYFVPVAGDDGVGGNGNVANGTNDNGGLHWDKNGNDCYLLGTPLQVTYACPIETTPSVHCLPGGINGTDILITGGSGNYTVVNQGAGNLTSGSVPNGGTAHVHNMNNNNVWEIDITDAQGCTATATGIFAAPVISNITIVPALTCPLGGNGDVNVTVNGTSGGGAPYTIVMAADPPTAGTTDTYSNVAGTLVNIVVTDQLGCVSDSLVTITSAGHFINVQIVALQSELCFGDGNGSATISAVPTPTGGVDNITWTGPSGQHPGGNPGGPGNFSQSGLEPGNWSITVLDNTGCEVTISLTIDSPQELDLYLSNSNEPVCYDFSDGSITVQSTGGSGGLVYTWNPVNTVSGNTFNSLGAGTYWAYVEDQNGCEDSLEIILGQPDSLWAAFTVKNILCFGDSTGAIIVDSVQNDIGTVSYFWNMTGIVPDPAPTSNLAGGLPVGTYHLIIQDAFCSNSYDFTLTQNPAIELIQFGMEPAFCRTFYYQSGNGVVYVSAAGGVPDYTYEWENLSTGQTSTNTTWGGLNPATYQITVTDDVNCQLIQTIQLDSVNPIADFTVLSAQLDANLEGTAIVCAEFTNQSQYFANINDPSADTTFFWELGYNLPWQISHDVDEVFDTCYYLEGLYEVCLVAVNKNNCSDTACKILTIHDYPILIAPNVFTPGGDNTNEIFQFDSLQVAIIEFECIVVDRWGKEIFAFDEITDGWDGDNKNGKPCDDGVYFFTYIAKSTNGTVFEGQGTVQLVRGNQ